MKKLKIQIDSSEAVAGGAHAGKFVDGYAALNAETLWVHVDGETFSIETSQRKNRRGKAGGTGNPGEILAPMPGKIIKLMTKAGDAVKAGDVVLVMEAMKMEYTLKAQVDGRVAEISAVAGQQVALGQMLARLDV